MRTGPIFEAFLARLYTDAKLQRIFLESGADGAALDAAREAGLTEEEARAIAEVDRGALRRTCESVARKRWRAGH